MAGRSVSRGVVVEFDDPAGLGQLRDDDGSTMPFHCTAIADGSRSIAVGARVVFVAVPGRGGQWEASAISEL